MTAITNDACACSESSRLRCFSLVATLDRRDFGVVRPRHVDALQLVP